MKAALLVLMALFAIPASAQVTITSPTTAQPVNASQTFQFTASVVEGGGVTWSCPGCAGSIDASGLYTAPATIHSSQSYGGYQLLPNDHIFNQRVDALGTNAGTTIAITSTSRAANVVTITVASGLAGFNYATKATIAGVNDASFNGTFTVTGTNCSNTQTCTTFTYAQVAGNASSSGGTASFKFEDSSGSATFSAGSEISFPANYCDGSTPLQAQVFNPAGTPGNNGNFQIFSGAMKMESGWLSRNSFANDHHMFCVDTTNGTMQEMYQYFYPTVRDDVCHTCTAWSGIRYANSTYNLPNAQGGGVDAAGLYILPLTLRLQETEQALANSTPIKHAFRMALQNGYICGLDAANACGNNILNERHIWPATAEAFLGVGLVPYGTRFRLKASFDISGFSAISQIILTALKNYGVILADGAAGGQGWHMQIEGTRWPTAYKAAFTEIVNAGMTAANFEAVDESSLRVSSTSGVTTTSEKVIATGITTPSHTASQQIVLTGVTVTLPDDQKFIQAGSPAQTFTAFIRGSANLALTWTMSPSVGTLTGGGLYTPPASVVNATTTTVTATSSADATVAASMTVTILPVVNGTTRIVLGQASNYTDSHGAVWQTKTLDDSCALLDNSGDGSWASVPDVTLYYVRCIGDYGDLNFKISLPNGTYNVTGKFAGGNGCGAGVAFQNLEANGVTGLTNFDICASAGGGLKPIDRTISATVSNGVLTYAVRSTNNFANRIQAIQIDAVSPPGPNGFSRGRLP